MSQHIEFALRYDVHRKSRYGPDRIREVFGDGAYGRLYTGKTWRELCGGQQKRVALARALVANPTIVMMDEPLSSLDPELNLHLRQEILKLRGELGFILVNVTYSRKEAADIGSCLIVMHQNMIVFRKNLLTQMRTQANTRDGAHSTRIWTAPRVAGPSDGGISGWRATPTLPADQVFPDPRPCADARRCVAYWASPDSTDTSGRYNDLFRPYSTFNPCRNSGTTSVRRSV